MRRTTRVVEVRSQAEVWREKLQSVGWKEDCGATLKVLRREPVPTRTLIEVPHLVQSYDVDKWNRWRQGNRAGFPEDKRLAYNHDDGLHDNSFGEAIMAGRFSKGNNISWSYYTLLTSAATSSAKIANGDEVREYLRRSRLELNVIPREVEGIDGIREPQLLVCSRYGRRHHQW